MFLGEYQHTLDAKGRVSLPAKFRLAMTGNLIVSKGFEDCLYVHPADAYSEFLDGLLAQGDFNSKYRKLRRFFTTGAAEAELDSAGRISVSPALREYAGLEKDVAVVGNGTRIEIWDAARWSAYTGEMGETIENDAEELSELGFL